MVHARPGEVATHTGVMIFRHGEPDIKLWVSASDYESAKAAILKYVAEQPNRVAAVFPDNLTAATFVGLTESGQMVGPGRPIDLQALGIVRADTRADVERAVRLAAECGLLTEREAVGGVLMKACPTPNGLPRWFVQSLAVVPPDADPAKYLADRIPQPPPGVVPVRSLVGWAAVRGEVVGYTVAVGTAKE
jgi:hypothetical protein